MSLFSSHAAAANASHINDEAGVAGCFAHGQGNPGEHNNQFGYEHQDSYNDPRALFATLYGVIKIAQLAKWHKGVAVAPAAEGDQP